MLARRFGILVLLASLGPNVTLVAQTVDSVAGGFTGDGGPATKAFLYYPEGLARTSAGDLYIAEGGSNRVRRVDAATQIIESVVGTGATGYYGDGGPARQARLRGPHSIAVSPKGDVVFADFFNQCFRRYEPASGNIFTAAGQCDSYGDTGDGGPATQALFEEPAGIVFAPNGDYYVSDATANRIRKVIAATGVIVAYAGTGESGDSVSGPALSARLNAPAGLDLDAAGNLYFTERGNDRVMRIEAGTGNLRLVAGKGLARMYGGDGGPAVDATLNVPLSVAVRGANEVLIGDLSQRIRVVDLTTGIINTLVGGGGDRSEDAPALTVQINILSDLLVEPSGNVLWVDNGDGRVRRFTASDGKVRTVVGSFGIVGDGGPATAAKVVGPESVLVDSDGSFYIGGEDYAIRKVDPSGVISTVVGLGCCYQNDVPGNETGAAAVTEMVFDGKGGLLFVEPGFGKVRRYDLSTKIVTLVAGRDNYGFGGDGGPATDAMLNQPSGVAVDSQGNVYVADRVNNRIRRVTSDGIIRTIAGTGTAESTGDGGPSSAASLLYPNRLAIDGRGRLLFSEQRRVRMIDLGAMTISTVAGTSEYGFAGDGGPAVNALLAEPSGIAVARTGEIYISDAGNTAIRVVDTSGVIRSINNPGQIGFNGDGGPFSQAALWQNQGIALDARGALYISDHDANRVRKVNACVAVGPFDLNPVVAPPGAPTSPVVSWTASSDAFRYDVTLDTANPPTRVAAADLTGTSFQAGGLVPGTTYYVQVVAKGDPYCPMVSTRPSAVVSFTVTAGCAAPGAFATQSPADGATGVSATPTLVFGASAGAGTYDVYLGSSDPPPLFQAGVTSTSLTTRSLTPGTTYTWRVVARAACDGSRTVTTAASRFTVAGACGTPQAFSLQGPPNGSSGLGATVILRWDAAVGASTYDLFLGPGQPSALPVAAGLSGTLYRAVNLTRGTTYAWRVVAHAGCDPLRTVSAGPFTFSVSATCAAPPAPAFDIVPQRPVAVGQSYVVSWGAVDGLDTENGAFYRVVRSTDSRFGTVLDSLDTAGRSASFTHASAGTVYHRVVAFAACGTPSVPSAAATVTFVPDRPRVVVVRQPSPAVLPQGSALDALKTTFELKNVSRTDFIGAFNTIQPIPFFRPADLLVSLRAGETKTFSLEFTGVPASTPGRYDGLLLLTSLSGSPLDVVPYATVALLVTPEKTPAAPVFGAESVAFAATPASLDPTPVTVTLKNPGTKPMALTGEVGPEVWMSPDPGWNATPLAPGETRTVRLRPQRLFGAAGGAFPRYTYFTVRTIEGATARLLVRDEIPPDDNLCASRSRLGPGVNSLVVPSVVKGTSALGNTFVSRLSIGNLGTEEAPLELFYTPDGGDGFDCGRVLAKRLVVPAGDVLSLTDPLTTLFGVSGSGQLEIRSAKLDQLKITSNVEAPSKGGGSFGFTMPAVPRGSGAALGQPNLVTGLANDASRRTNLILVETSGEAPAVVVVTLVSPGGVTLGTDTRAIPAYGKTQLSLGALANGATFAGASATVEVMAGRGAVAAVATVIDNKNDDASTEIGRPIGAASGMGATGRRGTRPYGRAAQAAGGVPFTVPAVVNGYASTRVPGAPWTFQTSLSATNGTAAPASLALTYWPQERGGNPVLANVTIAPRATMSWDNVLVSLFGIAAAEKSNGPMALGGDTSAVVMGVRVFSQTDSGSFGDALPLVPSTTESATGAQNATTLEREGLEYSIDPTRGTRSNLILTEFLGMPATVTVQLWEKGDRVVPISTQVVTVGPNQKVQLSTAFQGDDAQKDRTNVRITVKADPTTAGKVLAMVTTIDNVTGDTKNALLSPVGAATAGGSIGF